MIQEYIFKTIDAYIDASAPNAKNALQKIRQVIKDNVPVAIECVSYQIPAFRYNATFIYFAAFNKHVSVYPPLVDDESLVGVLAPYRSANGNLRFSLNEEIPYDLIGKLGRLFFLQYLIGNVKGLNDQSLYES